MTHDAFCEDGSSVAFTLSRVKRLKRTLLALQEAASVPLAIQAYHRSLGLMKAVCCHMPQSLKAGVRSEKTTFFLDDEETRNFMLSLGIQLPKDTDIGTGEVMNEKASSVILAMKPVCSFCGIKASNEWRRGPDGRKSLCNACGLKMLRKEKLQRKKRRLEAPSDDSAKLGAYLSFGDPSAHTQQASAQSLVHAAVSQGLPLIAAQMTNAHGQPTFLGQPISPQPNPQLASIPSRDLIQEMYTRSLSDVAANEFLTRVAAAGILQAQGLQPNPLSTQLPSPLLPLGGSPTPLAAPAQQQQQDGTAPLDVTALPDTISAPNRALPPPRGGLSPPVAQLSMPPGKAKQRPTSSPLPTSVHWPPPPMLKLETGGSGPRASMRKDDDTHSAHRLGSAWPTSLDPSLSPSTYRHHSNPSFQSQSPAGAGSLSAPAFPRPLSMLPGMFDGDSGRKAPLIPPPASLFTQGSGQRPGLLNTLPPLQSLTRPGDMQLPPLEPLPRPAGLDAPAAPHPFPAFMTFLPAASPAGLPYLPESGHLQLPLLVVKPPFPRSEEMLGRPCERAPAGERARANKQLKRTKEAWTDMSRQLRGGSAKVARKE